jgi:F0F1-type ATP synthase membrane subunit c/vacuolar-type H+-ATPase subunit K
MASQGLPLGRAVVGPANAVGEYGDGTVEGIADAPGVQFRGG